MKGENSFGGETLEKITNDEGENSFGEETPENNK
jgi:hypothetical protein